MSDFDAFIKLVNATFRQERKREEYIFYAENLKNKGLPLILSFQHLSDIFGLSHKDLGAMSFHNESFYRSFSIPKRSGGERIIDSPMESLAALQRWVSKAIFERLPVDAAVAVAYRKGASIKEHVSPHAGQPYLLKLDIKSFYPSISTKAIYSMLCSVGYCSSVAGTLASLVTYKGALPQGAPSSPSASNAIMWPVDDAIKRYCEERGLRYSRYADDLALSGGAIEDGDIAFITDTLGRFGFSINNDKTRLYRPERSEGRFLTGLVINNGDVRVPKKMRRQLRMEVYFLERHYLSDLMTGRNMGMLLDPLQLDRVLGRLHFWRWVEPQSSYPIWAIEKVQEIQRKIYA